MLAPELLNVLCCPETHQPLSLATAEQLALANAERMVNRAGNSVRQPILAGLIREDGAVLYPIWDDIPCLLIEEGILLSTSSKI